MCDNLGLRWRPPMRWHRIPSHCMLQHREWFVVPLSVLLRWHCKKQRNIPSCTKTTLCIHDCPVIVPAALQRVSSSGQNGYRTNTITSTVDWYFCSLYIYISFETNRLCSWIGHACMYKRVIFQTPHQYWCVQHVAICLRHCYRFCVFAKQLVTVGQLRRW